MTIEKTKLNNQFTSLQELYDDIKAKIARGENFEITEDIVLLASELAVKEKDNENQPNFLELVGMLGK